MYLGNSYEMIFVNNDGEEKFNAAIDAHTDLFGYGEGVTRNDYIDIYRRGALMEREVWDIGHMIW